MCSWQFVSTEKKQAGELGGLPGDKGGSHSMGREGGRGEWACSHPCATPTRITDRFHCLPICPDTRFRKAPCAPGGTLLLP